VSEFAPPPPTHGSDPRLWWFDGHLDLAYIADHGRDLARQPLQAGGTLQPASITFPSLRAANVRASFSTLFVRRRTADAAVPPGCCFDDPDGAFHAAVRQIDMHRQWHSQGLIELANPASRSTLPPSGEGLRTFLAIEGAACIRSAEDLHYFRDAGVRMVTLAWAEGNLWAGGDQSGGDISIAGSRLIERLDDLGCIHDVSHLSEAAFWTLLGMAKGKKVASHSNCRSLLPGARSPERHLSDSQIKALADAGGIVGINLFARFLVPPAELTRRRATIADVVRHLEHFTQIAGRRDFVALGSDMDSGFGTDLLPVDLQGPGDLQHLAEALADRGWSDHDIQRFATRWAELV
jgi:membrane dipeptidase